MQNVQCIDKVPSLFGAREMLLAVAKPWTAEASAHMEVTRTGAGSIER